MIDRTWILNRAVVSLVQQKIVSPFDEAKVKEILNQVFQAGSEVQLKERDNYKRKRIGRFDIYGKCLGEYDSILDASIKTGWSRSKIRRRSIDKGFNPKSGTYWKYL